MKQPQPHVRRDPWCLCVTCQKHRLAYALLVARNHGNLTQEDYEVGMMVLDTYLSMMVEK
jgi:hypothetical protein